MVTLLRETACAASAPFPPPLKKAKNDRDNEASGPPLMLPRKFSLCLQLSGWCRLLRSIGITSADYWPDETVRLNLDETVQD